MNMALKLVIIHFDMIFLVIQLILSLVINISILATYENEAS